MEFADPSGLISVFGRTGPLFLRSLIGFDDFERDTTAVAELVAVVLGPFADLRGVPLGT